MKRFLILISVFILHFSIFNFPIASAQTVDVGVMLPLHNVDGDGKRMVEYYRGMLLAVNQLKEEGMNINVHAWNVSKEADPAPILEEPAAAQCNIIFGPIYTSKVKAIGDFCRMHNIQMVMPTSISGNEVDSNPQIWQVYQSPSEIYEASERHLMAIFHNYHAVFVDCNDTLSKKGAFTFPLREQMKKAGMDFTITNMKSLDEMFAKAFSTSKPNIVVLNTGRSPEMRFVMDKLDVLTQNNPNLKVTLFGYTEWLMYTKYNKARFAKYNTYIPTYFYYNAFTPQMQDFITKFHEAYGQDLKNDLPQFAVMGYDHVMYFVGKKSSLLQTPLKFEKTPNGGYRNREFLFIHYRADGSVDQIKY